MWIPEESWVRAEPDGGRLVASVTVNGLPFLAEAFPVTSVGGRQDAGQDDETLGLLHRAAAVDGPFQTTTIAGHPYVVAVLPHA